MPTPDLIAGSGWTRGFNTNGSAEDVQVTVARPTSVVPGNLMSAFLSTAETGINPWEVTAPSGWTHVASNHGQNSAWWMAGGCWWKIAGEAEPGSYTWTMSPGGADKSVTIVRVTGHAATAPVSVGDYFYADNTPSPVCRGLTVPTAGSLVLWYAAGSSGWSLSTEDIGPYPTGTTGIFARWVRQYSGAHVHALAYEVRPDAGATGDRMFESLWNGNVNSGHAMSMAIAPSAGGGGGGGGGTGRRVSVTWLG